MNIGITQIDGKLPNVALMKVASYYEEFNANISAYIPNRDNYLDYDLIYMSKIFDFTPMPVIPKNALIGGTGVDFYNKLPLDIEVMPPSYTLYPECTYNIGFAMKGCRFKCKFCCVPVKEGKPYNYSSIDELLINPKGGNRLMLLDNDFFGNPLWELKLDRIINLKLKVCFAQGLNIRIITPLHATKLAKVNYTNSKFNQKYLTFAWDRFKDERLIRKGIDVCVQAGIPTKHMQFFVLVGFDTSPDEDLYRIELLRSLGCLPFVMPYNKSDRYQKALARWCNFRAIFKTVSWEDYKYNPFKDN